MEGLVAIIMVFSVPLAAILSHHRQQMARFQGGAGRGMFEELRAEIDMLRQEVRSLRDTSTQYDLSFDTALQRMDDRVEKLEKARIGQQAQPEEQTVMLGAQK